MKFSFIAKHRGIWAVDWICGAPGGFYAWLTLPRSQGSVCVAAVIDLFSLGVVVGQSMNAART